MANINQQQGRLKLIRDIGIDKQQRDVRMVFDLFGAETERIFLFAVHFSCDKTLSRSFVKPGSGQTCKDVRARTCWMNHCGAHSGNHAVQVAHQRRIAAAAASADANTQENTELLYSSSSADADCSGEIATDEIKLLMETLGQEPSDEEIKRRIRQYLLRSILVQQPVRFKLGGRPVLSACLNVETAGSEPKRPEIW
jgi:hypothetical protein